MNITNDEVNDVVKGITTLRLKFSTRIVLVKLIDLADKSDEIIIERLALSKLCNVSIETIGRAIKQLKDAELLKVVMRRDKGESGRFKRTSNKYVISYHRVKLAISAREIEIQRELNEIAA